MNSLKLLRIVENSLSVISYHNIIFHFIRNIDQKIFSSHFRLENIRHFDPSLLNCAPCTPSRLRALPIINRRLTRLRAFTHMNKCFTRLFFVLCCIASIAGNGLRLKNPRKATGPGFIPLKVIKFASNVIDSHLNNNIITYLEKKQVLRRDKNSIGKTHFQEK